jgi:ribosomal protein L14E/L6E/L27E
MKFKVGDIVKVVNTNRYTGSKKDSLGKVGVIAGIYSQYACYAYYVKVNKVKFCFLASELELVNNECGGDNMDSNLIKDAKYYVGVKFNEGYTIYDFAVADNIVLVSGDNVVCDTVRGFSVGEVVETKQYSNKATKYIIQKVDLTAHANRLRNKMEKEKLLIEMRKRAESLSEIDKFSYLAQNDGEMSKMLKRYKDLVK